MRRLSSEVNRLLETLQESDTLQDIQEQAAQDIHPCVLPLPAAFASPNEDWAIFLSIDVDADARRISQALTEPEYLEAWIAMPDQISIDDGVSISGHAEGSQIVATRKADGYRLDQYRGGRVIASFVGSFLFCHQRKMRLSWRDAARPDVAESVLDFRIRGNFGGSILELRHMSFQSTSDFLWHQQLWSVSLPRLASLLRSA